MSPNTRPKLEKNLVDANYLLKEAPRERNFITGAQAMAEAVKRCNVDMAIAYPITPQSEVMHLVADAYAQGHLKEYYRAEEELGTMSAIHGAARAGVRLFTATSGPGLLRGLEAIQHGLVTVYRRYLVCLLVLSMLRFQFSRTTLRWHT
jgi:pyruvate ferredoxin oxidoreductase alpha subunit